MSAGLEALDRLPVRDQWSDILDRAGRDINVVELTAPRHDRRRPRWTRAVAAASVALALVGTGILVGRSTSRDSSVDTAAVVPTGTWTVGPSIPVAAPDNAALPLLESSGGEIYASFRAGHEVVTVDAAGASHTIPIAGEVVALSVASRDAGYAVLLTRDGQLVRVEADGSTHTLAELGAVRSAATSVAISQNQVFVSGLASPGIAVVDATGRADTRTLADVEPSVLLGDDGVVWALNQDNGRLARIQVPSLEVTDTIEIPGVVAVAVDAGELYLARPGTSTVTRVDAEMKATEVAQIDPLTNSISVGGDEIWTSAAGVLTAYARSNGQLIGALARPNPDKVIALTYDGRSTWVLSPADGLRQLVRKR